MDNVVKDIEPITRFLCPKRHYAPTKKEIKAVAFVPPLNEPELSVYRIDALSGGEIWQIADDYVAPALKDFDGEFRARADLKVQSVRKQRLDVVSDPQPHERHACVVGWSKSNANQDGEQQKHEMREVWLELANSLVLASSFIERN